MDWLLARQNPIEANLARRHRRQGALAPYCPLARYGDSRDGRRGNPQIVFGLLSSPQGQEQG